MANLYRHACRILMLPLLAGLAGCNMVVMSPSGDIATQQRDLILVSTFLMLLIIIPVIALTFYFAWHYRRANTEAVYDPEWHHSTRLEVVIWSAPLAIIVALGAVTWISTHKLDPYRPIDRLDAERAIPADVKPLTVEVVALDWKWLFFYPEYGIATVNELAAPVDVPINFKITSSSVMNSFYIPALAGQIYAMPGMQTRLHAVINAPGVFDGFSANYSGDGFSHMRFKFHGLDQAGFDGWVAKVKQQGTMLNRDAYLKLEKPSEREPVRYYGGVENGLYEAVLNMCAQPGKMCMNEMMHVDMMGGGGESSESNRERLEYDNRHAGTGEGTNSATFPATGQPARSQGAPEGHDDKGQPNAAPAEGQPANEGEPANQNQPGNQNQPSNENPAGSGAQPMQHDMQNMNGQNMNGHDMNGHQMGGQNPEAPASDSGSATPDKGSIAPEQLNNSK